MVRRLQAGERLARGLELLGPAAVTSTTTYLFPSGKVRTGAELDRQADGARLLERLPARTRILVGFVNAGRITPKRSLARVAGNRWNYPSTYYRVPGGGIRTGAEIDSRRVPSGTMRPSSCRIGRSCPGTRTLPGRARHSAQIASIDARLSAGS